MKLSVSTDPVGAPIFYRDVPLMPSETEKGFIKPLATSAIPLIEWRMRNVAETRKPRRDDRPSFLRQLPLLLPPTARRWASIWTVRRTTRGCMRWFRSPSR